MVPSPYALFGPLPRCGVVGESVCRGDVMRCHGEVLSSTSVFFISCGLLGVLFSLNRVLPRDPPPPTVRLKMEPSALDVAVCLPLSATIPNDLADKILPEQKTYYAIRYDSKSTLSYMLKPCLI